MNGEDPMTRRSCVRERKGSPVTAVHGLMHNRWSSEDICEVLVWSPGAQLDVDDVIIYRDRMQRSYWNPAF